MDSGEINFSYGHTVTAGAGTSGEVSLLTVTAAKKLTVKRVKVHFPAGSQYYLLVALLRGAEQVAPNGGYLAGDDNVITVECNQEYLSGEDVKVWYNNTDAANQHSCFVLVEGVRE